GIRGFHVTGVQTCALPIYTTDSATHSTPHADMDTSAVRTTLGLLKQEVPMDATTVTIAAVVAVFAPLWTPANVALAIMFFLSCKIGRASCRERANVSLVAV